VNRRLAVRVDNFVVVVRLSIFLCGRVGFDLVRFPSGRVAAFIFRNPLVPEQVDPAGLDVFFAADFNSQRRVAFDVNDFTRNEEVVVRIAGNLALDRSVPVVKDDVIRIARQSA